MTDSVFLVTIDRQYPATYYDPPDSVEIECYESSTREEADEQYDLLASGAKYPYTVNLWEQDLTTRESDWIKGT